MNQAISPGSSTRPTAEWNWKAPSPGLDRSRARSWPGNRPACPAAPARPSRSRRSRRPDLVVDLLVRTIARRHRDRHRHPVLDEGDDLTRPTQPRHRIRGHVELAAVRADDAHRVPRRGHPDRQQAALIAADEADVVAGLLPPQVLASDAYGWFGHPSMVPGWVLALISSIAQGEDRGETRGS